MARIEYLLTIAAMTCASCAENAFQPPPPPAVTVDSPQMQDVVQYAEFTGRTEAVVVVGVPARVQGVLLEIEYQPGELVEVGDPLFKIDPEPFVAARDAAKARVKSAKAQAQLADTRAQRMENSAESGAISELQALEARAEADVSEAQVEVAEKELAIQELDVRFTSVVAPIKGRVMASPYFVGDLVGPLTTQALTTIYDDSKIYAWFTVPDRLLLAQLNERAATGEKDFPEVDLATEVEPDYPYRGRIDYVDPSVDAETGTLRVRAVFDNAKKTLTDGLFVRIRIAAQTLQEALVIPESAIGADQVGRYVYVVDDEGLVDRRNVTLGPIAETGRVVLTGVEAGDRLIVKGLLRARPGAKVTVQDSDA